MGIKFGQHASGEERRRREGALGPRVCSLDVYKDGVRGCRFNAAALSQAPA